MLFKKFISLILYVLIFSLIGAVFSSFAFQDYYQIPADSVAWFDWIHENWAVVALVLSEIAALLPSKPKGIVQAVVLIASKVMESKKRTKKREVL